VNGLHACPEKPDEDPDVWFLFANENEREPGDGEITEVVDDDGVHFALGDPARIEAELGLPAGALRR
jgi:hypothetical protein